ncbi:MFS transporter [Actinoplanes sp. TRM 88003]|uniref:MFS transporter n=1 Tax=Paractinoplanes aksuensis TaxID=2939490 RepID=A0ABT1E7K1_9ACTN|nr:MFS transporter [Actinoplanes aksuensis]MCO8277796.1 MFS transporter [Actinoplanes aksuensis]
MAESSTATSDRPARGLLRDTNFRRWYLARSISYAGTAATAVALPMLAYQQSGSAALTGAVAAAEALPYLLFGLPAGAVADRSSRLRLMIIAELLAATLVLSAPVAHAFGHLNDLHIVGVAAAIGTAFCWFDAAAWGALTRVAGRDRLVEANSLIWATATVTGIAVPAVAGVAATVWSPAQVLIVDALSYLASIVLLRRIGGGLEPDEPRRDGHSLRSDIVAGLSYLWRQPVIRTLSLTGFCLSTTAGGTLALLVVHAREQLGLDTGDRRVGLLYTAAAVGALLSALALPRLSRAVGVGRLSIAGYLMFLLAVLALAGTEQVWAALLLWAACDFASATAITNGITVRQQLTPDHLQGRVNTTGRMIAWGGTPVGAALGGLIADTHGVATAYALLAAPVALGLGILLFSPVRRLGHIDL